MKMRKGKLFIIAGPSGVGKGTVIRSLLKSIPELELSVSVTTRQPRAGEVNGKDYYFVSPQEFERMREEGKFLEHARHYGIYYATPEDFVNKKLTEGKSIVLEIDTNGAFQVKEKMPQSVSVFLAYPSLDELKSRLLKRGTETEEMIALRLEKAQQEYNDRNKFDHVVVNNELDETVKQVLNIFRGELYDN